MTIDRLGALRHVVDRMAAVLSAAPPASEVPACPEWTVADLTAHIISVHRWAASIMLSTTKQEFPDVRPEDDLAAWYARMAAALLATVDAVDPRETCWTMDPTNRTVAFWRRRQLHETLVHSVDVAQARPGEVAPIDPDVAVDGIDEVLTMWLPRMERRGVSADLVAPVCVRANDTGDAWLVTPRPGEAPEVTPGVSHESYVAGPAADVFLMMWKRAAGPVDVHGDAAERFLASRLTP